ncbi:MAG: efflux RND transporter periplasmic adaptor subunit [Pseudomonadota bacterium]
MQKKTLTLWALLLLAAVVGTAWLLSRNGAAAPAANVGSRGPAPQVVSLALAQRRDLPVVVEATGTVVSLNSVEIRPQVSSTVRSVAIKEGQFVRKGELLFSFDDRSDRANLEKARAQLLRDRATLADLERQWQRAQDLRAQNFIAQSAADTVLSQLQAQRALVQASEAAVHASQVDLSYNAIRSPLAGRAGAIAVYPGSLVQPGGQPLVTISQVDPIGVSFTVPEAQLNALLGRESGAALQVQLPGDTLQGKVSFVDNTVDPSTGTIRVKGVLPNPRQQLWPGQFVTVRMTLRTLKDATVVPQAALILRGDERLAYVVDGAGLAQLRPVQLLHAAGEWAAVAGVQPGEKVVLEGKQNLRPGTPVQAGPAEPAASGAAR